MAYGRFSKPPPTWLDPRRAEFEDDDIWESISRLRADSSLSALPLSRESWDSTEPRIGRHDQIRRYDAQFPMTLDMPTASHAATPANKLFEGWDDPELQYDLEVEIDEAGWEPVQDEVVMKITKLGSKIKHVAGSREAAEQWLTVHRKLQSDYKDGPEAWAARDKMLAAEHADLRSQHENLEHELLQLRNKSFHLTRLIFRRKFARPLGRRGDDIEAALAGDQPGRHGFKQNGWPLWGESLSRHLEIVHGFYTMKTGIKLDASKRRSFSGHQLTGLRLTGWPLPGQTLEEHAWKTQGAARAGIQLTKRQPDDDPGRFGLRQTGWPRSERSTDRVVNVKPIASLVDSSDEACLSDPTQDSTVVGTGPVSVHETSASQNHGHRRTGWLPQSQNIISY